MLIWARVLAVVGLMLFQFACTKQTGSHTDNERNRLSIMHSEIAFEFILNDNLDVAQGEAEEALKLNPRGVEANHAMARVFQYQNDDINTIKSYQSALRTDPYRVDVLNDYAHYLCSKGQFADAYKYFDRAGSQLMSSIRMVSYTRAGACALGQESFDKAQMYLLKAHELNPQSAPVLLNLLRISVNQNKMAKAKQYLKQYLDATNHQTDEILTLSNIIYQNN